MYRAMYPAKQLRATAANIVVFCLLWLLAGHAQAAEFAPAGVAPGFPQFLPVDQAFQFSALQDDGQLLLRWQIAPGYYLYRSRLGFNSAAATSAGQLVALEAELPPGIDKVDEYFGEVQVYYQILELTLPLVGKPARIDVQYQGCADAGLCYPPKQQSVALDWAR
jgi:thiol:disulfide interchange protein DsbD